MKKVLLSMFFVFFLISAARAYEDEFIVIDWQGYYIRNNQGTRYDLKIRNTGPWDYKYVNFDVCFYDTYNNLLARSSKSISNFLPNTVRSVTVFFDDQVVIPAKIRINIDYSLSRFE